MRKFRFHLGVTLRSYGNVDIEAESIEAALPLLTADYISDKIEIHETTTDSGQDLNIIDVSDAETDEKFPAYEFRPLPSPYDPQPDPMFDFIKMMANFTTPEDEFASWADDHDEPCPYEDADELVADLDDERLGNEYSAFMNMIRRARELRNGTTADAQAGLIRDAAPEMLSIMVDLLKPGSVNAGVIEAGRDLLAKLGHDVRPAKLPVPSLADYEHAARAAGWYVNGNGNFETVMGTDIPDEVTTFGPSDPDGGWATLCDAEGIEVIAGQASRSDEAMPDLKTYSVLIAWNDNDAEEGEYGATVRAANAEEAEAKARALMAADDQFGDDDAESPREFGRVIDLHEGAIWKAADMESILRDLVAAWGKPGGRIVDAQAVVERAEKILAEIDSL